MALLFTRWGWPRCLQGEDDLAVYKVRMTSLFTRWEWPHCATKDGDDLPVYIVSMTSLCKKRSRWPRLQVLGWPRCIQIASLCSRWGWLHCVKKVKVTSLYTRRGWPHRIQGEDDNVRYWVRMTSLYSAVYKKVLMTSLCTLWVWPRSGEDDLNVYKGRPRCRFLASDGIMRCWPKLYLVPWASHLQILVYLSP